MPVHELQSNIMLSHKIFITILLKHRIIKKETGKLPIQKDRWHHFRYIPKTSTLHPKLLIGIPSHFMYKNCCHFKPLPALSTNSSMKHIVSVKENIRVSVCRSPTVYGQLIIENLNESVETPLFNYTVPHLLALFQSARTHAHTLAQCLSVHRVAMVADEKLHLFPLAGLEQAGKWQPVLCEQLEFHDTYPGYITSKSAPHMSTEELDRIHSLCTTITPPYNNHFHGEATNANLFAKIIRGELQQWRIWENETHVAFLTPFANTPGFTVLVPRQHLSSDIFSIEEPAYLDLVTAAKEVAECLKKSFQTDRIGMIFEGFEIDYAHVKLIPIVGGKSASSDNTLAPMHEKYPGYVTSQAGPSLSDEKLTELTEKLTKEFSN